MVRVHLFITPEILSNALCRSSRSTLSPGTVSTPARANFLSVATARCVPSFQPYHSYPNLQPFQVFRFASSKNASLFLQRKNPRKIAWTVVYRKMHKKGITEEVAKKRSRKTVKHQRGIVGADLATIAARRNQTAAVRTQQRLAAITKAKTEKKEKETKKAKVRFCAVFFDSLTGSFLLFACAAPAPSGRFRSQGVEAADEGWKGWAIDYWHDYSYPPMHRFSQCHVICIPCHPIRIVFSPALARGFERRLKIFPPRFG